LASNVLLGSQSTPQFNEVYIQGSLLFTGQSKLHLAYTTERSICTLHSIVI